MYEESRIELYDYLENLFTEVTENVYPMHKPEELTKSDTEEGFIVITVDNIRDASEFKRSAFGWARAYVKCYIPHMSRGRLNKPLYESFEDGVNDVIQSATEDNGGQYWIDEDSILSMDDNDDSNADNAYSMFVKSFIVFISEE